MPKKWMRDLDEEALKREAHFEIRPWYIVSIFQKSE